jgi:hypothetical protein
MDAVMDAVAPAVTGCYPVRDAVPLAKPRSPAPSGEVLQVQT